MNQKSTTQNVKNDSRFTRWVNEMDEKDKSMAPHKRKRKWVLLTGGIFILFILSFLLFPSANPGSSQMSLPTGGEKNSIMEPARRSAFDFPVDSFENHLKIIIDENLSEKK